MALMLTVCLVVYFSLVPAITASYFCRELVGGQVDAMLSLPGRYKDICFISLHLLDIYIDTQV